MLILVGLNHRTAPVDVRERLSVSEAKLAETTIGLAAVPGVDGAAVLSTCNRVEAIVSTRDEDVIEAIVEWLAVRATTVRAELEKHLYILRHGDVVRHIFPRRLGARFDDRRRAADRRSGAPGVPDRAASWASLDPLLHQLFDQTDARRANGCAPRPASASTRSPFRTPRSSWRRRSSAICAAFACSSSAQARWRS